MPDGKRSVPAATRDMPALTALRAVAAFLVFLYHFPPRGLGYLVDIVASQGHVGVTVFFVLSGFLITLRYYPCFERGECGLGDYFVRRGARILPLYYVVLTLTHLLSTGAVPLDAAHLPEWTLTQALFSSSPEAITVPTSWSLTVEECFYASAPLVFLGVAAFRRRLGALLGSLLALGSGLAGLYLAGSLVLGLTTWLGAADLQFLSDELLLRSYTVFGRFPDFAVGAAAGLLFLSGRVEAAWRLRSGALISSLLAVGGAVLLVAAQAGMVRGAADPTAEWRWNLLVVLASAVLVLALTCPHAPLSRLLSYRLPVYLGRISYALYLIQLTPLGNGLLYRMLPGRDGVHLLALYLGMNVVSALLFELVEEPGRETILALWRARSGRSLVPARGGRARCLSLAILLGGLAAQHTAWALATLAPIDAARVERVLGSDSRDVVRVTVGKPNTGREPRVRLPSRWRLGPAGDRRAPPSLLVFVDGNPVTFLGAQPPEGPEAVAYYRRPRAEYLSLQIEPPAAVVVVNQGPLVALALAWSRLVEAPIALGAPLPLLAAAGFVWWTRRRWIWAPRSSLALAASLATAWVISGIHLQPWAPLALSVELLFLAWLASSRGAAPPLDQPGPRTSAQPA
jgi:peptidoglycan/LPS O-acetylase OafA/YrhL